MSKSALGLNPKTDVLPFVVATVGEFAALYYWLRFVDAGNYVAASVALWVGFGLERIAVALWLLFVYAPKDPTILRRPIWKATLILIVVTVTEVAIWLIWHQAVGVVGHVLAGVILMVLMLGEHSAEMALVKFRPLFSYVTNGNTIFFTLMEVLGAVAWLYLVMNGHPVAGSLALLLGLSIEHVIQGAQLKPDVAVEPATAQMAVQP